MVPRLQKGSLAQPGCITSVAVSFMKFMSSMSNNNFAQKCRHALSKRVIGGATHSVSGSRPRRSATSLNGGRECIINQFGTSFRGIVQPHSKIGPICKEHDLPVQELPNKLESKDSPRAEIFNVADEDYNRIPEQIYLNYRMIMG